MIKRIVKILLKGSHWYCPEFNTFFPNKAPCEMIRDEECPLTYPVGYKNVRG